MTFLIPLAGVPRVQREFLSGDTINSATNISVSTTFGAESPNRVIVVFMCVQATAGTITCSIGGSAATQFANIDNSTRRARGFSLAVPTGLSGNIELATTGTSLVFHYAAYAVYGAASATPNDLEAKATVPRTLSFDVPANGVGLAAVFDTGANTTTWSGLTEDLDDNNVTAFTSSASDEFTSAQSPLSVTITPTGGSNVTYLGCSFGP